MTESEIKNVKEQEENEAKVDEASQLIDLMTLKEGSTLKEELKELELLELEKSKRNSKEPKLSSSTSLFGGAPTKSTSQSSNESPLATANQLIDLEMTSSSDQFNLKSFKELISNSNNEFEREWQSVFVGGSASSSLQSQNEASTLSPSNEDFGFFVTANVQDPSALTEDNFFNSLFPSQLINKSNNSNNLFDLAAEKKVELKDQKPIESNKLLQTPNAKNQNTNKSNNSNKVRI